MPPTTDTLVLGLSATQWIVAAALAAALILSLTWRFAIRLGAAMVAYIAITVLTGLAGLIIWQVTRLPPNFMGIWYVVGMIGMTFSAMGIFLGVMEFGCMRLLGLLRLGAIARVTYYEALLQPFTIIILVSGIAALGVLRPAGILYLQRRFQDVPGRRLLLCVPLYAAHHGVRQHQGDRRGNRKSHHAYAHVQARVAHAGCAGQIRRRAHARAGRGGDPGADGGDVRLPAFTTTTC